MNSFTDWIILIIFLAIGIGITALQISSHKENIRKTLENKGAKNISISWQPLDFDKSNHTYIVGYDDAAGERRYTSCKIHVFDSTIYWEDKP